MSAPGVGSAGREGAGNASPVAIPTRFVWPYGGKKVFLTGSFRRWSEHMPMSPVEGCPTVFQAICSLPPGFHQYKFYVDGEWRHDEQQPSMPGNYGIVNTLFLTMDMDGGAPLLSPGSPGSRTRMDVDNGNVPLVSLQANGPVQDGMLSLSEAVVQFSRSRVLEFLSTRTAYDLLPDSGKVIALDVNLPVKQAFHILHEQGVPVAPLWDSFSGQFVGILSPLDFILILRELETHGSNLTEEELEMHTISAWKMGKQQLIGGTNDPGGSSKHLVHASPQESLKDIMVKILQSRVSMIPVIHTPSEDESFPQLLHLASLSGILKCICRHFRNSAAVLPILKKPLSTFSLGTWFQKAGDTGVHKFAMLKHTATLSSALSLLVQAGVSSVPIVSEKDSLIDIYSRSDITALAKDMAYKNIHLSEVSIQEALQHCQDYGSPDVQRFHMCLRSDPLFKVMELLATPGVRRVYVVETASNRLEGVISLSDIFNFLLS